jgi:sarcosine oxidase
LRVTQEQPGYFAPAGGQARGPDTVATVPSIVHTRRFPGGSDRPLGLGYYALGAPGQGVKLGEHGTGPVLADPDRRVPADPAVTDRLRRYAAEWLPGVTPEPLSVDSCLYTSTPDEDFVLRRVGPVVVCSPCSGHGFKFVPAIGEATAALAAGTG